MILFSQYSMLLMSDQTNEFSKLVYKDSRTGTRSELGKGCILDLTYQRISRYAHFYLSFPDK